MKLTDLLNEQKISKLQLALRCNIPPNHLYNALNQKEPLYPSYRKKIARYFNIDEETLFKSEE